ncbi:MAG TPA: SAM-dependent methyltransferase [Trebonia sp.]|nr:SAM-dependent methyltransferase [Trebonia sp.]
MSDQQRESWMSPRGPAAGPDGAEWAPPKIDMTVPHPARRYDYWLGGKDNFAADRESGDAIAAAFPTVRIAVIENRRFVRRAVAYLAGQAGIGQFLDIGTGIPTSPNVHEIAQRIDPAARVAYVDNDPIVLAHARALLAGSAEGATAYIDADLRDPDKILADGDLRQALDFSRPVALILGAILHFIPDSQDPYGIVARLVSALPKGSYLVVSHATNDYLTPDEVAEIVAGRYGPFYARSEAEFTRFFAGGELVPPGIVSVAEWQADAEPQPRPTAAEAYTYCAVARVS